MAIMIENRQWIDDYEIDSPHCESEDWDQEILDDPNPPFFLEEVKFDWKDGMIKPVLDGQWKASSSLHVNRSVLYMDLVKGI